MYDDIYILQGVDLPMVGQFKAMYPINRVPARDGTWRDQLDHS